MKYPNITLETLGHRCFVSFIKRFYRFDYIDQLPDIQIINAFQINQSSCLNVSKDSHAHQKINPVFPLVYFLGAKMFIFSPPSPPAAEYDWLSASLWDLFWGCPVFPVLTAHPRTSTGPIKCSNSVIIRRRFNCLNTCWLVLGKCHQSNWHNPLNHKRWWYAHIILLDDWWLH